MSHVDRLSKYIQNKYKVSEPIFRLSLSSNVSNKQSNEILFNTKEDPIIHVNSNDPLSVLVASCFQQSFDRNSLRFTVNETSILHSAYGKIKKAFFFFIEKNLETSNPKSTKIFRFFKYDYEKVPSDIMISLWAYMKPYVDDNYRFIDKDANRIHFDNIINLLKAIESKYG